MFARDRNLGRQRKARTFDDLLGYDYVRNFVLGNVSQQQQQLPQATKAGVAPPSSQPAVAPVAVAPPISLRGGDAAAAFVEAALATAAAERAAAKAEKAQKKVRIAQSRSSGNLNVTGSNSNSNSNAAAASNSSSNSRALDSVEPTASASPQKLPTTTAKPASILKASQSAPIFPNRVYLNRSGGPESYTEVQHGTTYEPKMASARCYRVLTYIYEGGRNVLIDISNGYQYKDWGDKLTRNGVVYDTKIGAMSERFAPSQVTPTRGGNGYAPRVLVAFDCWGHSHKRHGGGSSLVYETVKFIGIAKCIDPITPFAKKMARMPKAPYYFPGPDHFPPPRQLNNRDVRINRSIKSFA